MKAPAGGEWGDGYSFLGGLQYGFVEEYYIVCVDSDQISAADYNSRTKVNNDKILYNNKYKTLT